MSTALPGMHYCLTHQGNHSHYALDNCTVCQLIALGNKLAEVAALAKQYDMPKELKDRLGHYQKEWEAILKKQK